jgi:hypothetical protein
VSDIFSGFGNDGASCRTAPLPTPVDTDGDGVADYHALDSDNAGIPDNVEGQATGSYTAPSGNDTDGDGLDNNYDPDNGGTMVSVPNTDGDKAADYLDTDSDNDGYTDCEEGINPSQGATCPLTGAVGDNGLLDTLDVSGDNYNTPNNGITNPDPDNGGTDMLNEYVDSNNPQAAYREFMCGKNVTTLTTYNWKLISIPCDTGTNKIEDLFSSLGTYGTNWVMYRQSALDPNDANNDNYETNSGKPNTNKTQMVSGDSMEMGVSYWIIADADHNITIDKTITDLAPSPVIDASNSGISDPDFTKVFNRALPNGSMNTPGNIKKYMAGNSLPYAFLVKDLYFSIDYTTSGTYHDMGDTTNNDNYIYATLYKHDSPDTSDEETINGGGYEALNAGTPGFDNGGVRAMEGFFIKIKESSATNNGLAFPLMMKNGSSGTP